LLYPLDKIGKIETSCYFLIKCREAGLLGMNKSVLLFIAMLVWSLSLHAGQSVIKSLRIWSAPDHVRLVFDTDSVLQHNLFTLDKPHRLVLDLKSAKLGVKLPTPENDSFITGLRSATRGKQDVRVVLDLKGAVKPKSFLLKPNRQYGHRLVVDLYEKGKSAAKRSIPVKALANAGERDVVIAVDAGHGGEDPGARGKHGTYEKDVVLAIARKLVKQINRRKGMRGVLVRNGDYYLGLRKRMKIARRHRADLFISIHADSFRDSKVTGASVYTLSRKGASSEAARWLAEKENSADLIGGVSLDDRDDTLASVLLDLSQIGTLQASSEAADRVLKNLKHLGKVHKRKVQQAGFVVLKSPDIPSILVETAFISSPKEEGRLKDAAHQNRLAKALASGIDNYFRFQPPPGTWLAAHHNREPTRHIIGRGDTLTKIARRYQVSLSRLRNYNSIEDDRIRIGQVLEIPGS
jgi:N-acetylmuramoyl-L-alanine amidase